MALRTFIQAREVDMGYMMYFRISGAYRAAPNYQWFQMTQNHAIHGVFKDSHLAQIEGALFYLFNPRSTSDTRITLNGIDGETG